MARTAVRKRKPRIEVYPKSGGLRLEFLKMEPREQYALLSAVRGPDCTDYNQRDLKAVITGRIRHIVFIDECPGCMTSDALDGRGLASVKQYLTAIQLKDNPVGTYHYIDHLRLAVRATKSNKIWGGHGNELYTALSNHLGC
jgi:hypothetical protein